MSDAEERDEQTAANTARDLAHLHRQVSDARDELSRLRHELDVTGTVAPPPPARPTFARRTSSSSSRR